MINTEVCSAIVLKADLLIAIVNCHTIVDDPIFFVEIALYYDVGVGEHNLALEQYQLSSGYRNLMTKLQFE